MVHEIVTSFSGGTWWASQLVFLPAAEGTEVSVGMHVTGGTGFCLLSVTGEFLPAN